MPTLVMQTRTRPRELNYTFWGGEQLASSREVPLALDTETARITDERVVPRLALAVASDGRTHVAIHPNRLAAFLLQHRRAHFVGHNSQFDFWVIDSYLRQRGEDAARVLWDACNEGRLLDTMLLDMLLQLATGRFRKVSGGRGGDPKVYPGSLAEVAADYTSWRVDKDDPYRERFGELIGLDEARLAAADPGFFKYAVADAAATRGLYPALAAAAYEQMLAGGYCRRVERYGIRPDALARFGYLSELIQVKAGVALAHLFRRGVRVDLAAAKALDQAYRDEMTVLIDALQREYPDVLVRRRDGSVRVTPTSRMPSIAANKLQERLVRAAEEMGRDGQPVEVPRSKGKTGAVSRSVKDWQPYADRHPFVRLWTRLETVGKRLGLLAPIRSETLHCRYNLLMRTGRTSCAAPKSAEVPGLNLQQVPRLPEFRSLFVPAPGNRLFVGDFATAELRTLAAVFKARFGRSVLADVVAAGGDPHAVTAAAVLGLTTAAFTALKQSDPTRYTLARQRAKALNFGIPGGLGADALTAYAKATYGVTLTADEAASFRTKLIAEVYPELNDRDGYLADDSMAVLARTLGVKEREAWDVFDRSGDRNPLTARGVVNVVRGTSSAGEQFRRGVWDGLARLARAADSLDPMVVGMIAREEGGDRLAARLLRQTAATLTGRLRADVTYTQSKNTPFQSLAADGAKLALWNLLYAGFDVVGFVHDEVLIELPAEGAERQAEEAARIMEAAMAEVMGHGIPAACEYAVADCWRKP